MATLGLDLTFYPVTPDRWPDLERLFGPRGAYPGCWSALPCSGDCAAVSSTAAPPKSAALG
jgi:hypothetical protein